MSLDTERPLSTLKPHGASVQGTGAEVRKVWPVTQGAGLMRMTWLAARMSCHRQQGMH